MPRIASVRSAGSFLLLALFSLAAKSSPTCANPIGKWTNQITPKSTLTITSVDAQTGQLSGSYSSPSGTAGQEFPLVGWLSKAPSALGKDNVVVISFAVNWGSYHTVTSWSGVCRSSAGSGDSLVALWHLANPVASYEWAHVLSGQDTFNPQ